MEIRYFKSIFETRSYKFFGDLTILLFDSGVCLHFNKGNALNLKINRKSKCKITTNLNVNKLETFPLKNKKKSSRSLYLYISAFGWLFRFVSDLTLFYGGCGKLEQTLLTLSGSKII